MSGHLWYLSKELEAFVFFDDGISVATKRRMVAALHIEHPLKGVTTLDLEVISFKELEDFFTKHTQILLHHWHFSRFYQTRC